MSWRPDEDEEEPRDWEVEPEEEKSDAHPTLGGTAPLARVVFVAILFCLLLGGALALVRGLGSWFSR